MWTLPPGLKLSEKFTQKSLFPCSICLNSTFAIQKFWIVFYLKENVSPLYYTQRDKLLRVTIFHKLFISKYLDSICMVAWCIPCAKSSFANEAKLTQWRQPKIKDPLSGSSRMLIYFFFCLWLLNENFSYPITLTLMCTSKQDPAWKHYVCFDWTIK